MICFSLRCLPHCCFHTSLLNSCFHTPKKHPHPGKGDIPTIKVQGPDSSGDLSGIIGDVILYFINICQHHKYHPESKSNISACKARDYCSFPTSQTNWAWWAFSLPKCGVRLLPCLLANHLPLITLP